ncbi:MAG: hypothetical protein V9H69_03360 [Anaerolineae bacterium]
MAGLFDTTTGQRLPAATPAGPFGLLTRRNELAELGAIRVGERDRVDTPPDPRIVTDASMERLGVLVGYDLVDSPRRAGRGAGLDAALAAH